MKIPNTNVVLTDDDVVEIVRTFQVALDFARGIVEHAESGHSYEETIAKYGFL